MSIAIIQANIGKFDRSCPNVKQTLAHDHFLITDDILPARDKAITPRLQAKVPKMFGWQLKPGYEYYLWLDGNISLSHPDTLKYFYDNCQGYDVVVWRHPRRPNIRQEWRYLRKGLREESNYLVNRYAGEWNKQQVDEIYSDKEYKDDFLPIGGIFMYRNTPAVQQAMKEWWYLTTRYTVFDQLSFAYILRNLKVNALDDDFNDSEYVELRRHAR